MKKILVLLMVAAILMTMLSGCKKEEKNYHHFTPASDRTSTAESTESKAGIADKMSGLKGTVSGNTYTNTQLGLRLTLGESWYVYSEEETASIAGIVAESFNDESVKSLIEDSGIATVFCASESTGNTVNINWEKVGVAAIRLTADSYIESALPTVNSALGSADFTNIVSGKTTVSFLGSEYPAISVTAERYGNTFYEVVIPILKGSYVCCITICTVNTDTCGSILGYFEPLK